MTIDKRIQRCRDTVEDSLASYILLMEERVQDLESQLRDSLENKDMNDEDYLELRAEFYSLQKNYEGLLKVVQKREADIIKLTKGVQDD